MFI
ncbi:hypothetical protein YPPY72_3200, partial [Yersinia pestis PY-72]|jgi:hypothetical protein